MPPAQLLKHPLDSLMSTLIQEVTQAARDTGVEVFMVGATARIILLEHVHGLSPARATRDMDFAFALESWAEFEAIRAALLSRPHFTPVSGVVHRLHYTLPGLGQPYIVDLIPFGGVETATQEIAWPPEASVVMNVAGYRDAYAAASTVTLAPGQTLAVASLPGIALLKLFAWLDRGDSNPKDATDLLGLMRQYEDAGNQERIYEQAAEATDYDMALAGAWLLGQDAALLASESTRQRLENQLFTQPERQEKLARDMERTLVGFDDPLGHAQSLLQALIHGFRYREESTTG